MKDFELVPSYDSNFEIRIHKTLPATSSDVSDIVLGKTVSAFGYMKNTLKVVKNDEDIYSTNEVWSYDEENM